MSFLVSIIIPAFNAEKFIAQTIRSAMAQTERHKEIIIVDDGSSDGTLAIANEFASNQIRIFSQRNKGASAARNKGFVESRGDYIQYLDADDLLEPTKIEKQLNLIRQQGDEYVYAGKWKIFYDHPEESSFIENDLWKNFTNSDDWLISAWTKQIWMHPSAWLTPRRLIQKAGLWNESLSLHDDGEFFCRVILQSKGVFFCSEAESYYRKDVSNSLSSIISLKAVGSHYQICQLYEKYLLAYKNSLETRSACAANYLTFHYCYFPKHTKLRKQAVEAAIRLGGADIPPQGTDFFYLFSKLIGWKMARRLENMYYGSGLNRKAIINRIKSRRSE